MVTDTASASAPSSPEASCDFLVVDDKQQTTVPGLYSAGDVMSDLHQISVAKATAAATAIYSSLLRNFK